MAQTGYTPIQLYYSSTTTNAPTAGNLAAGELAINITDGKLFYKDNGNAVQVISWKTTPTTAGGTGLISYTAGDVPYYASGTALSKLSIGANTTIMTSSGSAPQWSTASGITVGTATNIAGGAAGSVPYQTGAGATSLLGIGSAYQALQVNAGATAPSWQPSASSVLTTQGDLLYASGANTLARLAKDANATRYLSNTGTSNNPAWAQIALTTGVTGVLPVANGGTNASSASITAFNNITGYTATGATGTTSTKLVFSASPTMTGTATMSSARPFDLGGANTGSVPADGNWQTILSNGSYGLYQVMAGAHTSGKHSDGVFLAACTFGNNNQTSTLIVTNYNGQGQIAIQWSGNDLQLKTTYSFSPASITYSYFTLSQ